MANTDMLLFLVATYAFAFTSLSLSDSAVGVRCSHARGDSLGLGSLVIRPKRQIQRA